MNLLDLVVLVLAGLAAVAGYRIGLLARALSWAGMGIGLLVAARLLPSLLERLRGPDATGRLLVAAGVLLGGAFLGQAIGLFVGARLHLALPQSGRPLDRVAGAAVGVFGVMVSAWLLLPSMADVPGAPSRLARGSQVARLLADTAPQPPDTLAALRRLVGEGSFPQVFADLRPSPETGPPPADTGLAPAVLQLVSASSVRVEGEACNRIQEGSGVVVEEGVVVTNAHVVAGEDETELVRPDGTRVVATVVVFDPARDLAVLVAPDVGVPPLTLAEPEVGTRGAVLGYPGGGTLAPSPYEVREVVEAVGRDIYDGAETRRSVLVLASDLAPGDSGAGLVDTDGEVVGIAFAIAPDRPGTSYALTVGELREVLEVPRRDAIDTGRCLA